MKSEKASYPLPTVPTMVANTKPRSSRSESARDSFMQSVCGAIAHGGVDQVSAVTCADHCTDNTANDDTTDHDLTHNGMLTYLMGRGYAVAKVWASYLTSPRSEGGCANDPRSSTVTFIFCRFSRWKCL